MAKYSLLGKTLDRIARERDVNGPKDIEERVRARNGGVGPTRSAWQQIMTGDSNPKESTLELFLNAMDATPKEVQEVALKHLLGGRLAAWRHVAPDLIAAA